MQARDRDRIRRWLYLCAGLIALMVTVGGFVRLSRAGLSIVEWDVVMGVLPPIGQEAWQSAYDLYMRSPEGQKVNAGMSMADYQRIFYIEWFHRLLARAVGLVVALPLLYLLWKGILPRRERPAYVLIGLLFAFQGFLGWYMVASGLVDRPSVSHYRLTTHLLAALTLLALCLWKAFDLQFDDPPADARRVPAGLRRLGRWLLVVLVLQIGWGGFVAGLKAGHVSNTWPRMFQQWIPWDALTGLEPVWRNFMDNPAAVHFGHRWLAFGVLALAVWTHARLRGFGGAAQALGASRLVLTLIGVQILLGILTVLLDVQLWIALGHQANAVLLFSTVTLLVHRLQHR